jgi:prepilin-type N-terminal cleavage/methylation domain-containing protein
MCHGNKRGFALYEVLLGLAIFAIGVIALGRAVGNCVNAGALSADDARVRQILSNRMAEIQTTPGQPDQTKVTKINTGYGIVRLTQKSRPEQMKEGNAIVPGIVRVTLTADWMRGGAPQKKEIEFYVYRVG